MLNTYNHGQTSWDTFAFLGRFPIHTGPIPPLTPQTILDVCIQNLLLVSTLYRGGGRENWKKVWKRMHFFYKGTNKRQKHMNIALLFQGLLSMIVGILINKNLSWRDHFDLVALKISKTVEMESSSLCFPCSSCSPCSPYSPVNFDWLLQNRFNYA